MLKTVALTVSLVLSGVFGATAGEAEIKAAQSTIQKQLEAFIAGDNKTAYDYAAPNIKRIYPTLEAFMGMVSSGYQPVYQPQNFSFGKSEELSGTQVMQEVFVTGADGKNYKALYTLELQEDGTFRITGVSLRGAPTLST